MVLSNNFELPVHKIMFYGPFDLHKLLDGLRGFIKTRTYDFEETFKMKKGGEGWKFETNWKAFVKATPFVRKEVRVYFLIMEIRDIEVVIDGKKTKLQHGRGIIEVSGTITFGYDKSWKQGFLEWFLTYVYKEQVLGKWVDNHWYELQDMAALVRQLLNFEVK